MSPVPRARMELGGDGRVLALNAEAARLFDLPAAALEGQLVDALFDPSGEAWVRRSRRSGWLGLDERAVRTRGGRALRLEASDAFTIFVSDDTPRAALARAREYMAGEEARAELAGAVARELNDPMAIVQGRLELLLELGGDEEAAASRHLRVALDHARRVSSNLHLLRLVGRPARVSVDPVRVSALLREAFAHLDRPLPDRVDVPVGLAVAGDKELLRQVLEVLVLRLNEGSGRGLEMWVRATSHVGDVVLEIAVSEPGIVRPDVPLSGGGLDPRVDPGIAGRVLERIGGRVEGHRLGRGALFRLVLQAPPAQEARPGKRHARVLLVGETSRVVEPLLVHEGFEIEWCRDAETALALMGELRPDGLACGLDLPGVSGLTLVTETVRRWPELRSRTALLATHVPGRLPDGVAVCPLPVDRTAVLRALGGGRQS